MKGPISHVTFILDIQIMVSIPDADKYCGKIWCMFAALDT